MESICSRSISWMVKESCNRSNYLLWLEPLRAKRSDTAMPLNTSDSLPMPGTGRTAIKIGMYDKDNRMQVGGNMGIAVYSPGDVAKMNTRFVKILEAVRSDVQRQGEK